MDAVRRAVAAMTDIDLARFRHQQAVRNLKRLDGEAARRGRSRSLEQARAYYRDRAARTLDELRALEATQPAGELGSPALQPTSTQPDLKGSDHAPRI